MEDTNTPTETTLYVRKVPAELRTLVKAFAKQTRRSEANAVIVLLESALAAQLPEQTSRPIAA